MDSQSRKRRGSRQGAPALPSERIAGSKRNDPNSAASRSAASEIVLTPELVAALKRKVESHNSAMRSRRAPSYRLASLPMLKAVLRRGMGAFSTSHRPNVSSRQQWGMARVNAFLRLLSSGSPTDSKYVSDNDLLPSGHERHTGSGGAVRRKVASHAGLEIKGAKRARLKFEIYKPDARDGDNDGIVQEGTIWERPAGTHFIDSLGRRIEDTLDERRKGRRNKPTGGARPDEYHPSFRLVDKNNHVVHYRPTWSPERSGARTAGRISPSIGERVGTLTSSGQGVKRTGRAVAEEETDFLARRRPSTPQRMSNLLKEQRDKIMDIWQNGITINGKNGPRKIPGSKRKSVAAVVDHGLEVLNGLDPRSEEWLAGRHWYEQQHRQIKDMAERLNVDFDIAVAVVAATSVRNAWDQWRRPRGDDGWRVTDRNAKDWVLATPNLDLAEYLLQNWKQELEKKYTIDADKLRTDLESAQLGIEGVKTLQSGTYKLKDLPKQVQGLFMAQAAAADQNYGTGFMSSGVANALRILESGDIDANLRGPKVRSFFDNIMHFNETDAVTIDSIMIQFATGLNADFAGELLKRTGGGGKVYDRFGNDVGSNYGVYAVVAEAIHQISEQWNASHPDEYLSPSDVQAILWFYQRNLIGILNPTGD